MPKEKEINKESSDRQKKEYKIRPIHPFAARMAPEIAFEALKGLKKGVTILDPMVGSGTVLRTISEYGFNGMGFDIDPLSVLMAKAWTTDYKSEKLQLKVKEVLDEAKSISLPSIYLPWIDNDEATNNFIRFWFAKKQINGLRKLSYVLNDYKGSYGYLLKIALSRLIITKSKGASLAADVSHSRPHRVRTKSEFDVLEEFERVCDKLSKTIDKQNPKGKVTIQLGDARKLSGIENNSVAAIITSPPYLNALDYMRGHKLTLVWLGYKIGDLGSIRSKSVGAEKAPEATDNIDMAKEITNGMECINGLPDRKQKMIYRYALDMYKVVNESSRVLERKGRATLVVGNSCINEIFVENTLIIRNSAKMTGLKLINQKERDIPQSKRYLPSPTYDTVSSFKNRMRTEAIMTFSKK